MNIRLLSLSALAVFALSGCASTLTREEIADASNRCVFLHDSDHYTEAYPFCEKACENNDGTGCFVMGLFYNFGNKVERDYSEASQYYRKACDLNKATACFNLGNLYRKGK